MPQPTPSGAVALASVDANGGTFATSPVSIPAWADLFIDNSNSTVDHTLSLTGRGGVTWNRTLLAGSATVVEGQAVATVGIDATDSATLWEVARAGAFAGLAHPRQGASVESLGSRSVGSQAGAYYNTTALGSFPQALQNAYNDANANGYNNPPLFDVEILPGSYTLDYASIGTVIIQNAYQRTFGHGEATVINIQNAPIGGSVLSGGASSDTAFNWLGGSFEDVSFDGTNQAIVDLTGSITASPFTYTHGTTGGANKALKEGWIYIQGGTVSAVAWVGGGGSGTSRSVDYPTNGIILWLGIGDTVTVTYSVAPTEFGYSGAYAGIDCTAKNARSGSETSSPFFLRRCHFTNMKAFSHAYTLDGCERGRAVDVLVDTWSQGTMRCNRGTARIEKGNHAGVLVGGLLSVVDTGIGGMGIRYGEASVAGPQQLTIGSGGYYNGVGSSSNESYVLPNLYILYECGKGLSVWDQGNSAVGSVVTVPTGTHYLSTFVAGDQTASQGINNLLSYKSNAQYAPGNLDLTHTVSFIETNPTTDFDGSYFNIKSIAGFTEANWVTNISKGNYTVNRAGTITRVADG